jgi:pimeloyl-ACP methyl ester carboxylesterase
MKQFLKIAGIAVLIVVDVLAVGAAALVRPDIPYDQLQRKYGAAGDNYMQMPDGVWVHYRDEGPRGGRTLVLVHGFAASLMDWDAWAAALATRYRVIRLDLPGQGLTRAPAGYQASTDRNADLIDGLATRLLAPRFVLVGNSMGGAVAWNFAIRHGGWLDGLVLVDAGGWPERRAQRGGPVIFSLMRYDLARAVLRRIEVKPLIDQGLKSAFLDPALVTSTIVDRYADFARAPGHRDILMSGQEGAASQATVAGLKAVKGPTLVMHGEDDRLIPLADGQAFAHAIPGAMLITYPHVGHVPMEQIPARSANDLDRWLRAKVWPAPAGAIDPGPIAPTQ